MSKYEKLLERIKALDKGLTFEELQKVLQKNGYVAYNSGSSHYTFRKSQIEKITLPRHKPMKIVYIKLVKEALEQEGIL